MNTQNISKQFQSYKNIQSILFTTDYSNFQTFAQMQNFLQYSDNSLNDKILQIQSKISSVHEQYIRTSTVYQINNKKRAKEEELLLIERARIENDLVEQKKRLEIQIHPMTLVIKQKQSGIKTLYQTKQTIQDLRKLLTGQPQQIKRLLPLDQGTISKTSTKLLIFKQLFQQQQVGLCSFYTQQQYQTARNQIRKKFSQLKNKILTNFKQSYFKHDFISMKACLKWCQQYQLMEEVGIFVNQQVFKECMVVRLMSDDNTINNAQAEIRNFFFLLTRGFQHAFGTAVDEKSSFQIYQILGEYNDAITRKLIAYAFQKLIKQSIQNVLKSTFNSGEYLTYLQLFYTQSKQLLKTCQLIIKSQRHLYLLSTYFQSIFDIYLQSYLPKQVTFISNTLQNHISSILLSIKTSAPPMSQPQTLKKFSIKKITQFKIQQKVYNADLIKQRVINLRQIFTSTDMEKVFSTVKRSLIRNVKIAKINQLDRNRNQLMHIFIRMLGELLEVFIHSIAQLVPGFQDNTPPLQPEFFQIIPNINLILQRMEYLYVQNKKQAKYQFAQSLKLEQKKQQLITSCQKKLSKIVGDALANILTIQNSILKQNQCQYTIAQTSSKPINRSQPSCIKVIQFLQKYLKPISKIALSSYRISLLKQLGLQFINLLISHYSHISYTKQGLSNIFIDIANYKKIILQIGGQVEEKYKVLRSLIDVYVIRNQQKNIQQYVKAESEGVLKKEKQQIIKDYIANKIKNEKSTYSF